LYLVVPRTRRHFTPAQIATLAETDEIRSRTSKKNPTSREEEVRKAASDDLIQWIEKSGEALIREPSGSLVVTEVMLYAEGGLLTSLLLLFFLITFFPLSVALDKTAATATLHKALALPSIPDPHPIDLPPTARLYKTLLQGGHYNHTTNAIERVSDTAAFASQFVNIVGKDATIAMCVGDGNGAFVVAELCEALMRENLIEEKATVKKWFGGKVVQEIEAGQAKGKRVLLEKIALL
jgi:pumilio family protein 6